MTTNQTARVLELLKRFNNGEKVSIDLLQNDEMWFGKSEKTIRRDLDVIKEYFPESFEFIHGGKGEKGFYKAITKEIFDNFLDKDTIALMVQTFNIAQRNNILKSLNIGEDDKKIIDAKIKKSKECYKFITKPFETKKQDVKLLREIEKAIGFKQYATITYKESKGIVQHEIKPYKILFMNENFYLVGENVNEAHPFSIFRITNIIDVKLHIKTFHINPDIADFIQEIQTPYPKYTASYRNHLINVVVEVAPSKARFFKMKEFLPSQNTIDTKEDGTLVLSYRVTQEREIDELVKKWIPHMKVISPDSLRKKIEADLREYLQG
ncbi:helix-turn-helix transcriptional regulator [Sulfurimonas sp.]